MKKNKILRLSIIIPTRNSETNLTRLLKSIRRQSFKQYEVIIVDNNSSDNTANIAKKYNAKFLNCNGSPPQVAEQRNLGAKSSKGEYLYFIDSDMELSRNFLNRLNDELVKNENVDAWYIHEKIISNSKLLSTIRNFESDFIDGSVVSAARVFKSGSFFKTKGYDEHLSGGPSDWDLDIRMRMKKFKFSISNAIAYHHEENLNLRKYITKKSDYIGGTKRYINKWKIKDKFVFNKFVSKQYDPYYRFIEVFVEEGKWKRLIRNLHNYFLYLMVKSILGLFYLTRVLIFRYDK